MDGEKVRRKWVSMLTAMLANYRRLYPADECSDVEFLHSLMEHFYHQGLIRKSRSGKYILPDIEGLGTA